ncbi:OmpA family protein [Aquabacterium sp.]|uniref:OmpA family protein n=1 Tax=Aquabacterium sp. TaxID=1872578 RepID=UPI0035ADAB27
MDLLFKRRATLATRLSALCLSALLAPTGHAQGAPASATLALPPTSAGTPAASGTAPVIASGLVPDEATRAAIVGKLREVYGADRVVDQLQVGSVVAPPNWAGYVQKMVSPNLKQVSRGRLSVRGNDIELQGEVGNEAQRQQVASDLATSLNPTYTIKNQLRVSSVDQGLLDRALANRIVEFQPGSAVLTPQGKALLDEMAQALGRLGGKRVEVVGHTDAQGARASNLALSQARADAVKAYLVGKGIEAGRIATSGAGPDQPVASNDTPEGRSRNRRIEFHLAS